MTMSMIEYEKGPVMLTPVGDDGFLAIVGESSAQLGMVRLKVRKHTADLASAVAI
jgi:predicted regulator of Ras-like GTPase activity (Roadblock/LC7/MglB family)